MQQTRPVPVDFFIAQKTRVLVITGPNTGGKTICLKTVGLAAMMAKSGWVKSCLCLCITSHGEGQWQLYIHTALDWG